MNGAERAFWIMAWYNKLSDEDKRALFLSLNDKEKNSVEDAKRTIVSKLDSLSSQMEKENRFTKGLAANILGNYISDASIYLLARLLRLK